MTARLQRHRLVAISQRVEVLPDRGERRDSLDQRWAPFLDQCGLSPIPIANRLENCQPYLDQLDPAGIVLTGGGDLSAFGGDSTERDDTEAKLVAWARARQRPILGICRGMQHLLSLFGGTLSPVANHVARNHRVVFTDGQERQVNSYHNLGCVDVPDDFVPVARADDGTIEVIRHREERIWGLMWHPERTDPFQEADLAFFRSCFGEGI